jgi:hypothetical protein
LDPQGARDVLAFLERRRPMTPQSLQALAEGADSLAVLQHLCQLNPRLRQNPDLQELLVRGDYREEMLAAPVANLDPPDTLGNWAEVLAANGIEPHAAARLAALGSSSPPLSRAEASSIIWHLLKSGGVQFVRGPTHWLMGALSRSEEFLRNHQDWEGPAAAGPPPRSSQLLDGWRSGTWSGRSGWSGWQDWNATGSSWSSGWRDVGASGASWPPAPPAASWAVLPPGQENPWAAYAPGNRGAAPAPPTPPAASSSSGGASGSATQPGP